MRYVFLLLSFVALAQGARAADFEHRAWDQLLQQHVVAGDNAAVTTVDYAGLVDQQAQLDLYLEQLAAISLAEFEQWPPAAQLAFLINAYNAGTVKLVLSGYPGIESIKELGSWLSTPWEKKFIPLLGASRSLDDIEHGLIRGSGRYRDPRIHFAVNCASVGCPALRAEAYTAVHLDAQLEDQTRLFLSDRTRNRLQGSVLSVSPLFKWYREDFEQGRSDFNTLDSFFAAYAPALALQDTDIKDLQAGRIRIEYLSYDWRLNDAAPAIAERTQ
jgi:uncharacterized membrane protein (DUF2068 family)